MNSVMCTTDGSRSHSIGSDYKVEMLQKFLDTFPTVEHRTGLALESVMWSIRCLIMQWNLTLKPCCGETLSPSFFCLQRKHSRCTVGGSVSGTLQTPCYLICQLLCSTDQWVCVHVCVFAVKQATHTVWLCQMYSYLKSFTSDKKVTLA